MKDEMLARLGLEEVEGGEVFGGELIPWYLKSVAPVLIAAVGAIANNWGAFKEEFAEGFSSGSSGNW